MSGRRLRVGGEVVLGALGARRGVPWGCRIHGVLLVVFVAVTGRVGAGAFVGVEAEAEGLAVRGNSQSGNEAGDLGRG